MEARLNNLIIPGYKALKTYPINGKSFLDVIISDSINNILFINLFN